MAWNLKENIFSYFGPYEKQADTYKDANQKGVLERFNESVGEDYDDNHLVLILSIWENTRNPLACYQEYIQFLEDANGIGQIAGQTETERRRVLRFYRSVVAKKGTRAAYDLLFFYLGFTVVSLVEDFTGQTFDSPLTFDEGNTFDSGGRSCTFYDLELTTSYPINADLYDFVRKIIVFLEPVTVELRDLTITN